MMDINNIIDERTEIALTVLRKVSKETKKKIAEQMLVRFKEQKARYDREKVETIRRVYSICSCFAQSVVPNDEISTDIWDSWINSNLNTIDLMLEIFPNLRSYYKASSSMPYYHYVQQGYWWRKHYYEPRKKAIIECINENSDDK